MSNVQKYKDKMRKVRRLIVDEYFGSRHHRAARDFINSSLDNQLSFVGSVIEGLDTDSVAYSDRLKLSKEFYYALGMYLEEKRQGLGMGLVWRLSHE